MTSGIEKITDKIMQRAKDDAAELISAAKAEAEEIVKAASAEAESKSQEIVKAANEQAIEFANRRASVAELESRKLRLAAKQQVIGEAFEEALKKLCDMPADKYIAFLSDQIIKIAKGGEQVILNAKDKEEIGAKLIVHIGLQNLKELKLNMVTLSGETADIPGGFILRDKEVEYNNSFTSLVNSCREELTSDVADALF